MLGRRSKRNRGKKTRGQTNLSLTSDLESASHGSVLWTDPSVPGFSVPGFYRILLKAVCLLLVALILSPAAAPPPPPAIRFREAAISFVLD